MLNKIFLFIGNCSPIDLIDGIWVCAHNNGLQNNIHHFKVTEPITDDTKIEPIRDGSRIAKNADELYKKVVQYYRNHCYCRIFPPTFYTSRSPTNDFVEMIKDFDICTEIFWIRAGFLYEVTRG